MNVKYEDLTHENFMLFCAKHYDNPQCRSTSEFHEDLKRIKYIKKLFTRFENTKEIQEHLILNHLIILKNIFGEVALVRILFLKMPQYLHLLKPFLILLEILPETIYNIGNNHTTINTVDIPLDPMIVNKLRKYYKNNA